MDIEKEDLIKVFFELNDSDWHKSSTESVWCKQIDKRSFQIKNVPFYVKGIGYNDIIEAIYNINDENYWFEKVVEHSGNSTYRLFLLSEDSILNFLKYWLPLERIGCTYEKANKRFFSIDVPNTTNIYEAYDLLEKGLQDNIWDFEEGYCGHPIEI